MVTAENLMKSAYEIARDQRIMENKAFLASLGLEDTKNDFRNACVSKSSRSKRKRTETSATSAATAPKKKQIATRRSKRLRKEPAENKANISNLNCDESAASKSILSQKEMAEIRKLKYQHLMEKHIVNGVKLPPTATYQHTVHRVLSMSDKALRTRVNRIERAQGQYAVLKMRMFAEVLLLEGFEDISLIAVAALERLLRLPKFQKNEEYEKKVLKIAKEQKK
eukprot:g175.t1